MKKAGYVPMLAALLVSGSLISGCGPEKTVSFTYQRPAEYEISDQIHRLGIAEFGGQTPDDKKWGSIASDRLGAKLDDYNRKYNRYELVDRKRIKAILDERDLRLAISDSASAGQAGKLANADAMIYGTVSVSTRDERLTRQAFDPLRRGMKTVPYTRRHCLAAVTFALDNIHTGKTVATVSATREYDSETDQKASGGGAAKMLGFGGGKLPPSDQVVSLLIDQCVDEFLAKISPHEVPVTEKLRKGKTKTVQTGNKLAAAGDYREALECYEAAIQESPDDHGAAFNAGVMHEALGELEKAEELYDRAFQMGREEQYVFARKRVRRENQN